MPRGDRTGPGGVGTMTGRGAGLCAGNRAAGSYDGAPGKMIGGCRRGWRNRLPEGMLSGNGRDTAARSRPVVGNSSPGDQVDALQRQLDEVKRRLDALG